MSEQVCTLCRASKLLSDFPSDRNRPNGTRPQCKACLYARLARNRAAITALDMEAVIRRLEAGRSVTAAGCWEWTGPRSHRYGCMTVRNTSWRVHRLAAAAWLSLDLFGTATVLHRCDNPPCFNPDHLLIGTQTENVQDMHAKQRGGAQFGEAHVDAKLTEVEVRNIRAAFACGERLYILAARYGVHRTTIRLIVDRATWRHVA